MYDYKDAEGNILKTGDTVKFVQRGAGCKATIGNRYTIKLEPSCDGGILSENGQRIPCGFCYTKQVLKIKTFSYPRRLQHLVPKVD